MKLLIEVRNESKHKRLYTRPRLQELGERICRGERVRGTAELSVLLCGDPFIRRLNRAYRETDAATDVLSFSQDAESGGDVRILGDIVISLDTVCRRCKGNRARMRDELNLLFCHGLLHLLGYDHATEPERRVMAGKQARYLETALDAAWLDGPPAYRATGMNAKGAATLGRRQ